MRNQEDMLAIARRVFMGELERPALLKEERESETQVFVAVGLIITRGDYASKVGGGYTVAKPHSYSRLLNKLLAAGTGDRRSFPIAGRRNIQALLRASTSLGIHRSEGKGLTTVTHLLPPAELVVLAAELAENSAIDAFLEDATRALKLEQQMAAAHRRNLGILP